MSIDRHISLDTAIAQGLPDLNQSGAGTRREAREGDRQAFERALGEDAPDADDAAARRGQQDTPAPPAGAFGLFAGAAARVETSADAALRAALREHLLAAASQLRVGEGGSGRREVSVTLDEAVLPGVTVSVHEDEGRVVAAFVCRVESSRERLNLAAPGLAADLAAALARPTLVQVSTDDPEDLCLTESRAEPEGGGVQPSSP